MLDNSLTAILALFDRAGPFAEDVDADVGEVEGDSGGEDALRSRSSPKILLNHKSRSDRFHVLFPDP